MNKPMNIRNFEAVDYDPEMMIRDLGSLSYNGVTVAVELHAFAKDDERPGKYDYDLADIYLIRQEGTRDEDWRALLDEIYSVNGLCQALQAFMERNVEGESCVCWGESGAQNDEALAFGRNGW